MGTLGDWYRADPDAAGVAIREAISRRVARCASPIAPPRRRLDWIYECLTLAVAQTRIDLHGGSWRAHPVRVELERQVPMNWDAGVARWRELLSLTSSETWRVDKEVRALREIDELALGERTAANVSAWVTPEVRLHIARNSLRCVESAAPACATGAAREARLLAVQQLVGDRSSPESQAVALRARALLAAHLDTSIAGDLSALEARAPSTAAIEELTASLRAMMPRLRNASSPTLRPRLMALHARWVEACTRETSAAGHFVEGAARIGRSDLPGQDERVVSAAVSRLRAEGSARHARLANQHASAGRHGAAWLHGSVARSLGGDGPTSAAEAYVTDRRRVPWILDVQPPGCPWLLVPSGADSQAARDPATVATVSVRWEACTSEETRATRDEAYAWTTERRELISRPTTTCTPSSSYYGAATGTRYELQGSCSQGTTERYETVLVNHTGTRHVTAREVTTRVAAEVTARRGDTAVTLRFAPPTRSLAEVAYETPRETRTFTGRTVETERVEVRAALARWLGAEFRDAFLEAEAAALAEAARRARDDASAEEGYALSIIAARREIDDRAVAFFSRTYGVTRDALVAAIR